MSINDIFKRGEMSTFTHNVCLANEMRSFEDLMYYYTVYKDFSGLKYCNEVVNDELRQVYRKYRDSYDMKMQNRISKKNKTGVKLEDVVTDFDEIVEKTFNSTGYLEKLEEKLEKHWESYNEVMEDEERQKGPIKEIDYATSGYGNVTDMDEIKMVIERHREKQARMRELNKDRLRRSGARYRYRYTTRKESKLK